MESDLTSALSQRSSLFSPLASAAVGASNIAITVMLVVYNYMCFLVSALHQVEPVDEKKMQSTYQVQQCDTLFKPFVLFMLQPQTVPQAIAKHWSSSSTSASWHLFSWMFFLINNLEFQGFNYCTQGLWRDFKMMNSPPSLGHPQQKKIAGSNGI